MLRLQEELGRPEIAEYLDMKNRGIELEEITRIDIKRHPEGMKYSVGDPKYDEEFTRWKAALNKLMLRLDAEKKKTKNFENDADKK